MSHEINTKTGFPNKFPDPGDPGEQLVLEQEILGSYAARFPEQEDVLEGAFGWVKKFALKNGTPQPSSDETEPMEIVDFVEAFNRSEIIPAWLKLPLQMPSNLTSDEYLKLSPADQAKYNIERDGDLVVLTGGDLPPHVNAVLGGIYSLIGAEVLRDDHDTGETNGVVVRAGKYDGSPVYIEESYSTRTTGGFIPSLTVHLLDENHVQKSLNQLSESEMAEFNTLAKNQTPLSASSFEEMGVNRINYRQAAQVLAQAGEAIQDPKKREQVKRLVADIGRKAVGLLKAR